jgi:Domain of unknown function (DUF4258)
MHKLRVGVGRVARAGIIVLLCITQCVQGPSANDPIDRHESRLIYTKHARCRMDCRHITETEIKEILQHGTINLNKSDPYGRPDPKYALDGYTRESQHLRVVFAPTAKGLVVITCIELGVEWSCDCK